jgi:hypothetical protein
MPHSTGREPDVGAAAVVGIRVGMRDAVGERVGVSGRGVRVGVGVTVGGPGVGVTVAGGVTCRMSF